MFSKFFSKFKYSGLKKSASNLCASRMSWWWMWEILDIGDLIII
jgi:hypothetical protein